MSQPERKTQGHGAADGARAAVEHGDVGDAITSHLAPGMRWASDALVLLEARVAALEAWAEEQGYEPPYFPELDVD